MSPSRSLIRWITITVLPLLLLLLSNCGGEGDGTTSMAQESSTTGEITVHHEIENCFLGKAIATNGSRRLAFILGIGDYKNPDIPDLDGPPNDARRFYDLLTGKDGYGFPKQNVCLLLNKQATTKRVKQIFEQALIKRARKNDVAVFFYAGHGSRKRDKNEDEPDMYDETFVLHDSRTDGIIDLLDDEFNLMLARLHKKTQNITVILDSCNSGTATRAANAGTGIARFIETVDDDEDESNPSTSDIEGDGETGWVPETLPGLVVFTAASDGTSALEIDGGGIFTDALLQVLSKVHDQPLTYAQAARQIPPLVSARSYQIAYFQGNLDRPVFGHPGRSRPIAWEVISRHKNAIKIGGAPIPGIGQGAELRIYDGAATMATTQDPGKAKATIVITDITGLNATAHISSVPPEAPAILEGDLAVLIRPANQFLKIKVRLRPEKEPGGIPKKNAVRLRAAINKNSEALELVELTEGPGDFELRLANNGQIQLLGPENTIRNTYTKESQISANLWQHARQRAFLQLQGEPGSDFLDNETLQVQLVPAKKQNACADGIWEQAQPNNEQVIPLCHAWNVHVTLSEKSPAPLLVGGIILSTDGSIFGFPFDGRTVRLKPGEAVTFQGRHETFRAAPPLDVQDRVLVFGTQETNPVAWHQLTDIAKTRTTSLPKSGLHRALYRYLQPTTRGVVQVEEETIQEEENNEDSTWTLSSVPMRVEANQRFLKPDLRTTNGITSREYTIKHFDIRPYLPDDQETALYKVLKVADSLAIASGTDGIGYKQHAWKEPTDAKNLALGIDCSRAMWFAYTRAGLRYNETNQYLPTAQMVGKQSLMNQEFDSCIDDPDLQLGDILVYRDNKRGDGHTVMVIDSLKRIAWGSMGWDGGGSGPGPPIKADTGVEYQLIKYKKDWKRWDRKNMKRKACWRYRRTKVEALKPGGQPGVKALSTICNQKTHCGLKEVGLQP